MSKDLVDRLVARARASQPAWGDLPVAERVRRLLPLRDRVLDRAAAIADCLREEIGKPAVESILGEVLPSADLVEYWTGIIEDLLQPVDLELDALAYPGKRGTTYREARGVVAVIMPWNFPVALPLRTIVPALLAGNAVVFKPSEVVPHAGGLVMGLFSGLLPEGVLGIAQGGGDIGALLCGADVDHVVFTGSVATGRAIAHACAERLVPCSLELGGKDAALILRDADLDRAANGVVWGAMMNAGQNCASIERVYVDKHVADAFVAKVCAVVRSLRHGVEVNHMATGRQRDVVSAQVADARAAGGDVLLGGEGKPGDGAGREYPPTVVRVNDDGSALMREETFGPVVPIAVVEGTDEAITRANASRFGLTASIWTRDPEKGRVLARRLRAGVVTVNNHAFTGALPAAPWSGHGESGWGVTNSPLALDALTRPRFVLVDRSRAKRELWWFPYTPALIQLATAMTIVRSRSRGLWARAKAVVMLVVGIVRRARGG